MAQNGPHQKTINELADADAAIHTKGFWTAVRKLVGSLPNADLSNFTLSTFVPDAYKFDPTAKQIIIYEVENTSRLTADKLDDLAWFWFEWDCYDYDDWTVQVYVKDCLGTPARPLNMPNLYYQLVDRQIAQDAQEVRELT
ncbi:hypothetical protein [Sandarakinorhabdus sp.]|uniref:hypothetical protein n=1 Tax=Sandarakinorhabdus sp. TaxID=1916663 RepID=UPI00286DFD57|nr:hypothetical protein [Sandarakinorhabdus sp.]